jgi:hypothetical protein
VIRDVLAGDRSHKASRLLGDELVVTGCAQPPELVYKVLEDDLRVSAETELVVRSLCAMFTLH